MGVDPKDVQRLQLIAKVSAELDELQLDEHEARQLLVATCAGLDGLCPGYLQIAVAEIRRCRVEDSAPCTCLARHKHTVYDGKCSGCGRVVPC